MDNHVLYIRHMVCRRCVMAVCDCLEKLGLHPVDVRLGEARLEEPVTDAVRLAVQTVLEPLGFGLIDDRRMLLNEQIKMAVIELVHTQDCHLQTSLSDYLSGLLHKDYSALSKLFSELNHMTIERYFMAQRVEKVKELLTYGELTISEIALQLNYSSTAHLSVQFKNVTGFTPTDFRNMYRSSRKALDEV